MTTIDKVLKIDDINAILQELAQKKNNIDGVFLVYFTDGFEGYHARERNMPTHILLGTLTALVADLTLQAQAEFRNEEVD